MAKNGANRSSACINPSVHHAAGDCRAHCLGFAQCVQTSCRRQLAAKAGHLALYVLMLAVPVIGMIRQYGGGRGPLKVFGVQVMQGSPEKIEWMSNLGNMAHGKLGWLLFALVAGHIVMVVVHRIQGHDVLYRMIRPSFLSVKR